MSRGRPRKFETEKALNDAMLLFWRNGYRGTSVDDLSQALGINKPSLYAAFGDKEALFLQVVDHYNEKMLGPALKSLLQCLNLKEGLSRFFEALAEVISDNETPPGCLIACLLAEECCESATIKDKLAGLIEVSDSFFTAVFEKHKAELNPDLTAREAAVLMVSTLHGLSIRARAGGSKESLIAGATALMNAVLN